MSHSSRQETGDSSRPTLPPIRDLFGDELSRRPNTPHDSPSLPLARLRVSDEDDYGYSSEHPRVSSRISIQPLYTLSLGHSDPSLDLHQYRVPQFNTQPLRAEHLRAPAQASSVVFNQASHGTPNRSSYPQAPSDFDAPVSRNALHHRMHERSPQPRQRNTVPQTQYRHPSDLHYSYSVGVPPITRHRSEITFSDPSSRPWNISTTLHSGNTAEDDERTPPMAIPNVTGHQPPDDATGSSSSKYECQYCGKGLVGPAVSSHTGEKPFFTSLCLPVESCGRSFSVLSNMRRHARVHTTTALQSLVVTIRWYHRRGSSASSSSTNASRRSRSVSSNDLDDGEDRAEKRTRRNVSQIL
ncbi:hypothetical protein BDZ97DRAFT_1779694 [Flammula alnicola]|nr:hypothetical protein BDZ97DRAFT_1779694 [Flammula alnicola]